ncbi:MAG: response regulator [Planctomycetaceae bacterium]
MLTIIVVDDALTDRTLISGMLSRAFDCEIQTAENGRVAMEMITEHRPDLVLTDIHMPEMNGMELLNAIRDEFPMVPVVLMTAQGSEEMAATAMRAGATSYVPKRRLAQDLISTVLRILHGSSEGFIPPQLMHHLETAEMSFTLHNDPNLIPSVVSFLQRMLRCLPLGNETERLRVGLAVEAALLNALYHGNLEIGGGNGRVDDERRAELLRERCYQEPYRDRRIHLTAKINRDRAEFVIRDGGNGFDTSRIDPDITVIGADPTSGRGLALMQTIMDSMTFNEKGNQVTLVRNRYVEPAENAHHAPAR